MVSVDKALEGSEEDLESPVEVPEAEAKPPLVVQRGVFFDLEEDAANPDYVRGRIFAMAADLVQEVIDRGGVSVDGLYTLTFESTN